MVLFSLCIKFSLNFIRHGQFKCQNMKYFLADSDPLGYSSIFLYIDDEVSMCMISLVLFAWQTKKFIPRKCEERMFKENIFLWKLPFDIWFLYPFSISSESVQSHLLDSITFVVVAAYAKSISNWFKTN